MQKEWSNELTLKFLELYSKERLIWDSKDRANKSKHRVYEAWQRISAEMEIPIEELKSKKNSLMATFRHLIKRKKKSILSGADPDDVFQPIWFAYDLMESFLGHIYEVEETTNLEEEIQQSETSSSWSTQLHTDEILPQQENPKRTDPPPLVLLHNTKRLKFTDLNGDEGQKNFNESFDLLNHVLKEKLVEEDECEVYAKLLAIKLRKYPERMRGKIMYKIDGLLLDNPYPDPPNSSSHSWQSH